MYAFLLFFIMIFWGCDMAETIDLPAPKTVGNVSVEEAIARRRSCRNFSKRALTVEEVSQLLWACQGITDSVRNFRAAPSAGATYPFETYLVVGKVKNLEPGLYHYIPQKHSIELVSAGDIRGKVSASALSQYFIAEAPIIIILAAEYKRTSYRYGERAERYVAMEAGHIGENLHLQCEALGLGTVMVGAFYDNKLKSVLDIEYEPLYIMPVGEPK